MLENITKQDLNKTVWIKPDYLKNNRKWFIADATWKTLGKLAVEIANRLSWKDKPYLCDFWDCGDYVVVENVDKIKVTWNKLDTHPERVIQLAVKWMLPKNKLRKERLKRLKLFVGTTNKYDHLSPERI